MKIAKILIASALSALLWTACENDSFYYQDEARARIVGPYEWALNTDSLEFSFASSPSNVLEKGMDMTLYVMGTAAATDRTVNLEVVADKSTASSSHYAFPAQVTIPAGKLSANFAINLKRTSDLEAKKVQLYIKVAQSADFKPGVNEQNHFLLRWSDILSKPKNWDDLTEFFGVFSMTKYRFIIDTLGIAEFSINSMTWGELNNYKIRMKTALTAYNESHPGNPLKDENGQLVSF